MILIKLLNVVQSTLNCDCYLLTFCFVSLLGNMGLPADQVAQAFDQAISNFIARKPSNLQRIDVVIFDTSLLGKFQSKISSTPSAAGAPIPSSSVDGESTFRTPRKSNRSRIETLESRIDPIHRVKIYFTSNSTSNNEKVSLFPQF